MEPSPEGLGEAGPSLQGSSEMPCASCLSLLYCAVKALSSCGLAAAAWWSGWAKSHRLGVNLVVSTSITIIWVSVVFAPVTMYLDIHYV
jgi:hypothetical protein